MILKLGLGENLSPNQYKPHLHVNHKILSVGKYYSGETSTLCHYLNHIYIKSSI